MWCRLSAARQRAKGRESFCRGAETRIGRRETSVKVALLATVGEHLWNASRHNVVE